MRIVASTAIILFVLWAIVDQFNRYIGMPGGPTVDVSVSNFITIPTFFLAIFMALGIFFARRAFVTILLMVGVVAMCGPLWLATRHVYVSDKSAIIEKGLFFYRSIDGGDPENRCFIEKGAVVIFVNKDSRPLGALYTGVFPWSLRNSHSFEVLRHQSCASTP